MRNVTSVMITARYWTGLKEVGGDDSRGEGEGAGTQSGRGSEGNTGGSNPLFVPCPDPPGRPLSWQAGMTKVRVCSLAHNKPNFDSVAGKGYKGRLWWSRATFC